MTAPFPFTAVVGQSRLKLALKLVLVDPKIGGLLVSGGRGSAKSTLARSITALLGSAPFVDLPLGAGEEMLTGTLNLSAALGEQKLQFAPGLLARADEGVLYVDEVNLLPDHLVDLLLDAAASGINTVERDGISHQHPARFILLGTMNPDEGDLRPQLLDRFGLCVQAQTEFSRAERRQIVQHRLDFERDPQAFCTRHAQDLTDLGNTLNKARERLAKVSLPDELAELAAELCESSYSEGLRADLTLHRAARAHAALHGRDLCIEEDITAVAELALAHRRAPPPEQPPASGGAPPGQSDPCGSQTPSNNAPSDRGSGGRGRTQAVACAALPPLQFPEPDANPSCPERPFRYAPTRLPGRRHAGFRTARKPGRIDWWRTLIAPVWPGEARLCFARPRPNRAWFTLVLLDTSASTLAYHALGRAKSAVLAVAEQVRARRETFALITFGNQQTRLAIRPQLVCGNLKKRIDDLPGGGGTPLADALTTADKILRRERRAVDGCSVYLFSDGRAPLEDLVAPRFGIWTVVDTEARRRPLGLARHLAQYLGADYKPLDALRA